MPSVYFHLWESVSHFVIDSINISQLYVHSHVWLKKQNKGWHRSFTIFKRNLQVVVLTEGIWYHWYLSLLSVKACETLLS